MWPGTNTWFQPGLLLAVLKPEKSLQKSPWTLRSHLRIYMFSHDDLAIEKSAPIYIRNDWGPQAQEQLAGKVPKKKNNTTNVCFKVIDCFLLPPSLLFFFKKKRKTWNPTNTTPPQSRKPTRHLSGPVSDIAIFGVSDLRATGWIHDVDSHDRGDSRFEPQNLKKICNRQVGTFPQGSGWKFSKMKPPPRD